MAKTTDDQFFESNGVPIRYIVQGSGQPVVLIHGFTGQIEGWAEPIFLNRPFDGFQLIPIDCRGHGKSGKPHDPSAYGQEMVNDVIHLLDHLEIPWAHIVGYSMGAEIALKMVTQYPARVYSAVLGGSGWSDDSVYTLWRPLAESLERGEGLRALLEWSTPEGQTRTADEIKEFEEWNQAFIAREDTQALSAICRNYDELGELRVTEEEIRAIPIPVLGIAGELDQERPMLERMASVAPDFKMIVLEGLNHFEAGSSPSFTEETYAFLRAIGLQEEE